MGQDLRYAFRMLVKSPGFTVTSVLALALGIGANSAIFSVINGVLLKPLPFREPERLIKLWETFQPAGWGTVSVPNLRDWREQNEVFERVAAYQTGNFNLQGSDQPERILGATVSPDFFDALGVAPRLGRAFQVGEDEAGRNRVVILSDQLWERRFGADSGIVGREIALGGENFTVIGVMPPSFRFPSRTTELWVPLVFTPQQAANRGSHYLFALGRLKPGASLEQAREQMVTIARRIEQQYPEQQAGRSVRLIPLKEEMVQNVRPALLVLLGAVGFVLLISCTNVATLLLARGAARRKETAIRAALGAGRGRLVRQFLTESLVLALLGGAAGLLLAEWGVGLLVTQAASVIPRASEVGLDGRVVSFTLLVSLLTGIVFGLVPAIQISGTDVQEAIKEGGRAGEGPQRHRLRSLLVIAEVALALVLLVGAGLMIRSFVALQHVETGLRAENVLTMRLSLPEAQYPTPLAAARFYQQVIERVTQLPGVVSAGLINLLPLQEWGYNGNFEIEGRPPSPPGQAPLAEFRAASPDYFRAMGIPLVAGRFFNAQDQAGAAPVALINETLARRLFPREDPLGKRLLGGVTEAATIVGIVGDVKQSGLTNSVRAEIYVPYPQARYASLTRSMSLVVRSASDPTGLGPALRSAVRAIDPAQPIFNLRTMEMVIAESVSDRRLNMVLLGIFAAVALILAVVGIYSVMAYAVAQRTHELGIRMALGAERRDVLRLVVGQGMALAGAGIGLGLVAAFGVTRVMASLLFGVSATDPLTFGLIALLLGLVALLACLIPARRATKVDPMIALRYE